MIPDKKYKGDLGAMKVAADLTEKGYTILSPMVCESMPFDIVAYKDGVFKRIQCKYSSYGIVPSKTSWSNKSGSHSKVYSDDDFDYYGIYLPDIKEVIYPSVKFKGVSIATEARNSTTPFYWWEDFKGFTDSAERRTYKDFNITLTSSVKGKVLKTRKVERPSKEELKKLLWELPTQKLADRYGVSDKAVEKWAKRYGVEKPPRGYWAKEAAKSKLKTLHPPTLDEDRPPPYIG